jgi:hypothetical protein
MPVSVTIGQKRKEFACQFLYQDVPRVESGGLPDQEPFKIGSPWREVDDWVQVSPDVTVRGISGIQYASGLCPTLDLGFQSVVSR